MVQSATSLADHASQQSDRWLFIAMFILFVGCLFWVARYFVSKHDQMQVDHRVERASLQTELRTDRDKYQTALREVIGQQNQNSQALVVVLERNTDALKSCTDELRLMRGDKRNIA